ncbi:MAG: hypothetical protein KBG85_11990 [Micropruina sp.]|nr:hypothetical protein [Micropruina sp.]
MSYLNDVTFQLRMKNYTDDEIRPMLLEIERRSAMAGKPAQELFGKPAEYTQSLQAKQRTLPGRVAILVLYGIGLALGVLVVLGPLIGVQFPPGTLLLGVVPYVLAVTAGAVLLMHKLPDLGRDQEDS